MPMLKIERKVDVVWITLSHPKSMNALSSEMVSELEKALEPIQSDQSIRCLVFTGEGRAFSAGGDLRGFQADLAEATPDRLLMRMQRAQDLLDQIDQLPMPVIAAVNGYAIAGGLELALCCDLIVAAESAMIGDGHAKYGIIPAGGSSFRLPRKISANRANMMLLTAELFSAQTLEQWGLVNLVAPDAELVNAVSALAKSISAHSPLGLKAIKRLSKNAMNTSPETGARAEIQAFRQHVKSSDFSEGLAAFVEKRLPVFQGR